MEHIIEAVLKGERQKQKPGETKKIDDFRILDELFSVTTFSPLRNASSQV